MTSPRSPVASRPYADTSPDLLAIIQPVLDANNVSVHEWCAVASWAAVAKARRAVAVLLHAPPYLWTCERIATAIGMRVSTVREYMRDAKWGATPTAIVPLPAQLTLPLATRAVVPTEPVVIAAPVVAPDVVAVPVDAPTPPVVPVVAIVDAHAPPAASVIVDTAPARRKRTPASSVGLPPRVALPVVDRGYMVARYGKRLDCERESECLGKLLRAYPRHAPPGTASCPVGCEQRVAPDARDRLYHAAHIGDAVGHNAVVS